MANTHRIGQRTVAKALQVIRRVPDVVAFQTYQASRWATPQPWDLILFRPDDGMLLVEVRTGQWGIAKPQTRQLAALPGTGYHRQIWRFRRGVRHPDVREWERDHWQGREDPWEKRSRRQAPSPGERGERMMAMRPTEDP